MNKLNSCDKVMDTYFGLDKGERVPMDVTLHLLTCKKCRKQVKMIKSAEKISRHPLELSVPINDATIEAVMKKVMPEYNFGKNPISIGKWIVAGIIMIVFMLTFGLSSYQKADETIMIAFYVLFALSVVVYCAVFVGTNMDFFVKLINSKKIDLKEKLSEIIK